MVLSLASKLVALAILAAIPARAAAQRADVPIPASGAELRTGRASGPDPVSEGLEKHAGSLLSGSIPDAVRPLGLPVRAHPAASNAGLSKPSATTATVVRTAASLTAVVALILLGAFVVRFLARRRGGIMAAVGPGGRAPSGVVEVLARYPVARSQTLILLKLPRRVLVLSQTRGVRGAASLAALSEITEAEEVAELVLRTREADNLSMSRRFGSILSGEERGLAKLLSAITTAPNTRAQPPMEAHSRDPRQPAHRYTSAPSGDRVELSGSAPGSSASRAPALALVTRESKNIDSTKRGYTDAPKLAKPNGGPRPADPDLQQRLAALRQIALERNRRAS